MLLVGQLVDVCVCVSDRCEDDYGDQTFVSFDRCSLALHVRSLTSIFEVSSFLLLSVCEL
jgi:hypothetical protein